ncbi:MAG TPA: NADP-dependent oxidoreductase [Micropruina sp.]|nr:NADP-dependent oxidoreductase [Micropruina sp.]
MRAVTYDQFGDDSVLAVTQQPLPKVAPGEVLVRVRAAGVNPVDWKVMSGGLDALMETQFPVVPGWDVAGVIEQVGIDVTDYAVGDEVIGYARKDWVHAGTFAEFVAVPRRCLAHKPARLSWHQAAGLPLAGLTAYQVLHRLGLAQGRTVLIHGGAGGVGSIGVQLAAAAGARVIATASEANHDYLRELGAEPVTYGDGLADRVRALAPDGVDIVADFVGGVVDATVSVLAKGGVHASIADPAVLKAGGQWMWVHPDAADLAALADLVQSGAVNVEVAATFGLDEVPAAFALSREGHTRGKIVIDVA